MTTTAKSSLARLALFALAETRFGFDMARFVTRKDGNFGVYDPHTVPTSLETDQIESLCLAGHAPLALGKTKAKESWDHYLARVVFDKMPEDELYGAKDFLFFGDYGQTRLQAVKRVLYFLLKGLPKNHDGNDQKYLTSFNAAKVREELEKFVKLDVKLDSK
jgi:hypothetical protein